MNMFHKIIDWPNVVLINDKWSRSETRTHTAPQIAAGAKVELWKLGPDPKSEGS